MTGALATLDALLKSSRDEACAWLGSHRLRAYGATIGALSGKQEMQRRRRIKRALETYDAALRELQQRRTSKATVEEIDVQARGAVE